MNPNYFLFSLLLLFTTNVIASTKSTVVKDINELNQAIKEAVPGNEIVMANGVWNDVEIKFQAEGTKENPIYLKAETAGKVLIQGKSDLKLAGEYLVVDGLYFVNGASPSRAVIEFAIDDNTLANHCRVTNCVLSTGQNFKNLI